MQARLRRTVTGRALVLGTVIVLLLVLLASPLSRYFSSRSAANDAATQLTSDRAQLAQLRKQIALWADPGYIQQQARARLQYAMPGDTVYVVVNRGQRNDIVKSPGNYGAQPKSSSWNQNLWTSVEKADAAK